MDVTDASPQRMLLGVEQFVLGNALLFNEVVFYKSSAAKLAVDSFSSWPPDQATESHAKERIARSKQVLEALLQSSGEFREAVAGLEAEFTFCYDYGNGSLALAAEAEGKFQWLR